MISSFLEHIARRIGIICCFSIALPTSLQVFRFSNNRIIRKLRALDLADPSKQRYFKRH